MPSSPRKSRASDETPVELSKRKRQVMDAVYAAGSTDVEGVCSRVASGITYSAARATLNALVADGLLLRTRRSRRMVYVPAQPRESAASGAARRMVATFFGGSISQAVAGMLGAMEGRISKEELGALSRLIREAKQKEDA